MGKRNHTFKELFEFRKMEVLDCNHHAALDPRYASLISPHECLIVQRSMEFSTSRMKPALSLSLSIASLECRAARVLSKKPFCKSTPQIIHHNVFIGGRELGLKP